jgi:hypothetical protein
MRKAVLSTVAAIVLVVSAGSMHGQAYNTWYKSTTAVGSDHSFTYEKRSAPDEKVEKLTDAEVQRLHDIDVEADLLRKQMEAFARHQEEVRNAIAAAHHAMGTCATTADRYCAWGWGPAIEIRGGFIIFTPLKSKLSSSPTVCFVGVGACSSLSWGEK